MSTSTPAAPQERQAISLFRRDIVSRALIDSFTSKLTPALHPATQVVFVVEIGRRDHDRHLAQAGIRRSRGWGATDLS